MSTSTQGNARFMMDCLVSDRRRRRKHSRVEPEQLPIRFAIGWLGFG
jgi:hypothetical protein